MGFLSEQIRITKIPGKRTLKVYGCEDEFEGYLSHNCHDDWTLSQCLLQLGDQAYGLVVMSS